MTSPTSLDFIKTIVVSGVATTYATQILKSSLIPIPFQRSPRLTAFIVSLIASIIAVGQGFDFNAPFKDWTDYVPVIAGTLLVSAATYKAIYHVPTPTNIQADQTKVTSDSVTVTQNK
jgi:hypothetical protein